MVLRIQRLISVFMNIDAVNRNYDETLDDTGNRDL